MNKRIIDISFILLISIVCAVLFLVYWKDAKLGDSALRFVQERSTYAQKLSNLNELILKAETGQRGYLISRDASYLTPYAMARQEIDSVWIEIKNTPKTNTEDQLIRELEQLINKKLDEINRTVELVQDDRDQSALGVVKTDVGRLLMEEIQSLMASAKSLNQVELDTAREKLKKDRTELSFILIGCIVLAILIILINQYMSHAKIKELDRKEEIHRHKLLKLEKVLNLFNSAEGIRHFISVGPLITKSILEILVARYCCMVINGRQYGLSESIYYASDSFGNPHFPDELKSIVDRKVNKRPLKSNHAIIDFAKTSDIPEGQKELRDFLNRYGDNMISMPLGPHGVIMVVGSQGESDYQEDELYIFDILSNAMTNLIENSLLNDGLNREQQNKDNFIGQLGHEIRNPLAVISSTIDGIRYDIYEDSDEPIDIIERQCLQISHLVDDLLDITRISKGKFDVKLKQAYLLDEVTKVFEDFKMMASIGKRKVRFINRVEREDSLALLDTTRIHQLMMNLLMNAHKFSDIEKPIEITLDQAASGTELVLTIKDEGVGLSSEQMQNIFTPFWQAEKSEKNGKKGLGLGLALVKEIVLRHNGQIEAHSPGANQGSTFTMSIGKYQADSAIQNDEGIDQISVDGRTKILVVDDEIDLCKNTVHILQKKGFNAVGVHNGKEALKLLGSFKPNIVLTDISMPGEIDGYGVAKAARRLDGIKLLAMSGMTQDKDREKALSHGFHYFFAKPIRYKELLSFIELK